MAPAKKGPADKTPAKRGPAKVFFFAGEEGAGEEGAGESRRRKGAGVGFAGEKGVPAADVVSLDFAIYSLSVR